MEMHMELERRLAAFKNVEAVVVFQSGFTANAGTVSAILTKDDVVVSDELNHASIIDGCRLSRATIKVFPHKDVDAARKILKDLPAGAAQAADHRRRVLDGRRSRPAARAVRARRGVRRDHDGRRCACERGVRHARAAAPSIISTATAASTSRSARCRRPSARSAAMSPARRSLIEFLYHRARPFLFSTSHPPAVAAACIAALDVLENEPQWMEQLWDNTPLLQGRPAAARLQHRPQREPDHAGHRRRGASSRPRCRTSCFRRGVFAQSIGFPTVARGQARLRTIVTATHTREDLQFALDMFGKVGKELGVIAADVSDQVGRCRLHSPRAFFETYTQGLHQGRPRQAVHARNARGLPVLRARHQHGRARGPAVAPPRRQVRPGVLPRLHDAAVAGAPRHLRRWRWRPAVIGLLQLFNGFGIITLRLPFPLIFVRIGVPGPLFADGTLWLLVGFLLMNLLVLLEVADRLSLKRDLEVAREIQQAMLPDGTWSGPGVEAFGLTQPANTVGGDFYDILPQPDGTVIVALGDVAGKASPAALLMALLLAMMRTLVDEGLPSPALVKRLNLQVGRHAPPSRFITLFLASYRPSNRDSCSSSTPARRRRCCAGRTARSSG